MASLRWTLAALVIATHSTSVLADEPLESEPVEPIAFEEVLPAAQGDLDVRVSFEALRSERMDVAESVRFSIAPRLQVFAGLSPRLGVDLGDTGIGIPADVLPRIFDPFFTTKPVGQGTGLGLALTRRVVDTHGGELDVETAVGLGTTMRMWFPLELAPALCLGAAA